MFNASGQTDRHDAANSHLLKLAKSPNMIFISVHFSKYSEYWKSFSK